jgi:uncharacterized protein DUF4129
VITRRLLALGAGVTALVVVAGIASRGRPLSAHRGAGPSATFFDYLATSLVIFVVLMVIVFVWSLFQERVSPTPRQRNRWHLLSYILSIASGVALAALIVHSGFEQRLRHAAEQAARRRAQPSQLPASPAPRKDVRNAHLRWDEIVVVLLLLGGATAVVLAKRRARNAPRAWWLHREEAVAQAFDESLDDLRNDPDLRRAIIAAYARMERALASVGLGRSPSEAPFEYVERALATLDAGGAPARRLTALFEWAKFSQHEPEPEMRDEAIAALVAVRDELRRPPAEADAA